MNRALILFCALALSACGAVESSPTSPKPTSPPVVPPQPVVVTVFNALDVDILVGTTTALNITVPANSTVIGVPVSLPNGTTQVSWTSKGQKFSSGEKMADDLVGATVPIAPSVTVTSEVAGERYFSPRFTHLFAVDTISYKLTSAVGERCLGWQTGSGLRWGYYKLRSDSRIQLFAGPGCVAARSGGWWTTGIQSANISTGIVSLNSGSPYPVSFTLMPTSLTLVLGTGPTRSLSVLQRDALGRDVGNYYAITWQSGAPSIASVSSTGAVTGLATGSTIITASSSGGGISALAQVTVRQPVPTRVEVCGTVTFYSCSSAFLSVGTSVVLQAGAFDGGVDISDRCTFTWRSSDAGKVTISPNGVSRSVIATRIASGAVSVFASCQDVTGIFTLN